MKRWEKFLHPRDKEREFEDGFKCRFTGAILLKTVLRRSGFSQGHGDWALYRKDGRILDRYYFDGHGKEIPPTTWANKILDGKEKPRLLDESNPIGTTVFRFGNKPKEGSSD